MLAAIKCIGVGWILLTFFIVLRSYISLVNGGKDPFSMLFGAVFTLVLIGIVPVAIAKMAWRFIN
ncbi:Phage protein [Salmonella enterica subsp. enterica serovar Cubana]|nr:Phage protein [Salmonella enterica subsp. enterica serovar Cubana]